MSITLHQIHADWCIKIDRLTQKESVAKHLTPHRGEVWTCDFGQNVGSELNKVRPGVIIQNDIGNQNSPTTIVLPISHHTMRLPTHVDLSPTDFDDMESCLEGTILAEQLRVVSKARLGRYIGAVSREAMLRIENSVLKALAIK